MSEEHVPNLGEEFLKLYAQTAFWQTLPLSQLPTGAGELHFLCPPGIGDVAWIMSKWWQVARYRAEQGRVTCFWFPSAQPRRVGPYVELLGLAGPLTPQTACEGQGACYGYMSMDTRFLLRAVGDPGEVPDEGIYVLHANRHLETGPNRRWLVESLGSDKEPVYREGGRLGEWCPYLPYEVPVPPDLRWVGPEQSGGVVVHMCHAGYPEGNLLYGAWSRILRSHPDFEVVLIGGNDQSDLKFATEVLGQIGEPPYAGMSVPPEWYLQARMFDSPLRDVLLRMRRAKCVIGPASGMMILAIYMGVPTIIAYPRWLRRNRFHDPEVARLLPDGTNMPGNWEPAQSQYRWCYMDELEQFVRNEW